MTCGAILLVGLALATLSFVLGVQGRTLAGFHFGGDFAAFYVAGKILNEYEPEGIYDLDLQYRLYHELRPDLPGDLALPYAYPPFLALFFSLLARLSYPAAYAVWLLVSGALYLAGLALIWPESARRGAGGTGQSCDEQTVAAAQTLSPKGSLPKPSLGEYSRTMLLVCLSFPPFLFECWIGGQLSSLGFFGLALCLRLAQSARHMASGAALSICLYKPSLLLLLVPMVSASRQWSTLAGLAAGALALGAISAAGAGWGAASAWLSTLRLYGRLAGSQTSPFRLFKFVDANSFLALLTGAPPVIRGALLAIPLWVAAALLAAQWWRSAGRQEDSRRALWAATIAWTLVFNLYVPIYDTTLAVLSGLLMMDVIARRREELGPQMEKKVYALFLALHLTAWFSQGLARLCGFQVYTILLVALGVWALRLAKTLDAAAQQKNAPQTRASSPDSSTESPRSLKAEASDAALSAGS